LAGADRVADLLAEEPEIHSRPGALALTSGRREKFVLRG